jgi:hypothetical protein
MPCSAATRASSDGSGSAVVGSDEATARTKACFARRMLDAHVASLEEAEASSGMQ